MAAFGKQVSKSEGEMKYYFFQACVCLILFHVVYIN